MAKAIFFSLLMALFICIDTADIGDKCFVDDPLYHGTYAPHPTDCNGFLQCTNGYFSEKFCPVGLHWSVKDTACQWPEAANCELKVTDDPPGTDDVTWQPTIPTVDCAPTCSTVSFTPTDDDSTVSYPGTDDDIATTDTDVTESSPTSTDDSTVSYPGTDDDIATTDPDVTWQPTSPTVDCAPTCSTVSFTPFTEDSTLPVMTS